MSNRLKSFWYMITVLVTLSLLLTACVQKSEMKASEIPPIFSEEATRPAEISPPLPAILPTQSLLPSKTSNPATPSPDAIESATLTPAPSASVTASPSPIATVTPSSSPSPNPTPAVAPEPSGVTPQSGLKGTTMTVTMDGLNFTGVTASGISFGAGITINSITVNNDSQITANMSISAAAATGYRNVSVTTTAGNGTLSNAFNVIASSDGGGTPAYTTPPVVSSTSPANNANGVAINTPVAATFSEGLNASTVNATTFSLKQTQGGTAVQGTVSYANNIATFTPSASLAYRTSYMATLIAGVSGVKDLAGNPLANDYIWIFTTTAQSSGVTVSLSSSPGIVTWNEICEASVNIQNVTNFTAYQFNVSYDPAVLEVIGNERGAEGVTPGLIDTTAIPIYSWAFAPVTVPGTVRILGGVPPNLPVIGSGYLAKIHFKVTSRQTETTSITFTNLPDNRLFDQYGVKIPAGSITWTGTTVNVTAS